MSNCKIKTEYRSMKWPYVSPLIVLSTHDPEENRTCHMVAAREMENERMYKKLAEFRCKDRDNHIIPTSVHVINLASHKIWRRSTNFS